MAQKKEHKIVSATTGEQVKPGAKPPTPQQTEQMRMQVLRAFLTLYMIVNSFGK